MNNGVSYNGAVDKLLANLSLMTFNFSGSFASSIASDSYFSWLVVINSGKLIAFSRLAASLLTKELPIQVSTGNPIRSASLAVVPAL